MQPVDYLKVPWDKTIFKIETIGDLVGAGIGTAIVLSMVALLVFLVWGGVQWLTSGGDKAALDSARGRITNALVGMTIVASAWAIFQIAEMFFGVRITTGGTGGGGGGGGGNAEIACVGKHWPPCLINNGTAIDWSCWNQYCIKWNNNHSNPPQEPCLPKPLKDQNCP